MSIPTRKQGGLKGPPPTLAGGGGRTSGAWCSGGYMALSAYAATDLVFSRLQRLLDTDAVIEHRFQSRLDDQ